MIRHQHHEGWPTSGEGAQTFAAVRRAQAEETSPPAYHRSVILISHKRDALEQYFGGLRLGGASAVD
jgi:hypothetical protein